MSPLTASSVHVLLLPSLLTPHQGQVLDASLWAYTPTRFSKSFKRSYSVAKKPVNPPTYPPVVTSTKRTAREIFSEPSTWAGVLSVIAAVITGGVSTFTDPALLTSIGAGISLILTKEGR